MTTSSKSGSIYHPSPSHTDTYTRSLPHTLTHAHTPSPPHPLTHAHTRFLTQPHTLTPSPSHTHTHTFTLTPPHTHLHLHPLTPSHPHTLPPLPGRTTGGRSGGGVPTCSSTTDWTRRRSLKVCLICECAMSSLQNISKHTSCKSPSQGEQNSASFSFMTPSTVQQKGHD